MNKKIFSQVGLTILSVGSLMALTGCVGYVDGPRGGVYVQPAPVFIEQDDYVYYPSYQMYYGSRSQCWYYREGSSWVARPAPHGVSVDVILAAPSVRVDFHDSPAVHHHQVVKSYPKNWKAAGGNPGHKEDKSNEGHKHGRGNH